MGNEKGAISAADAAEGKKFGDADGLKPVSRERWEGAGLGKGGEEPAAKATSSERREARASEGRAVMAG